MNLGWSVGYCQALLGNYKLPEFSEFPEFSELSEPLTPYYLILDTFY